MNGREPFAELVLRSVEPSDAPAITDALRRSSRETLYRRFHSPIADPAPFVERFVRGVDGRDHGAWIVLDGERVVAVAQWDRVADEWGSASAEVAIAVEDTWQHHGLGRVLLRVLAGDAHRHGITTLVASVLAENRVARRLASELHPSLVEFDGAQTRYLYALAS